MPGQRFSSDCQFNTIVTGDDAGATSSVGM